MAGIRGGPATGMKRFTWVDWTLLCALVAMWGTAFTWTKIAVDELAPALVVGARLVIGAVVLLCVLLLLRRSVGRTRRHWIFYTLIGVFGNAVPFLLISWGQQAIDSGQAGILMAVMPLFTLVFAHYLLPDEPLSARRIVGFLLGFAGIVVLMGPDSLILMTQADSTLLAKLAVLAGAVCYAAAAVLARLRPRDDATGAAAATTLAGAALLLPWLPWKSGAADTVGLASADAVLAVLMLGVFSTAIAGVVYFKLIERAGAGFVSQLNYLVPLWAVVIGIIFLGEQPEFMHGMALLLVFCGLYVAQRPLQCEPRANSRGGLSITADMRSAPVVAPTGSARGPGD